MTDVAPIAPPADDLRCPVCDYELRGLPEPRCPECGYAFEWAELRERARRRQLWFYEHSGTFKAHRQTRWRSLWPASFWKGIHAYSDAHAGRLAVYGVVTLLLTAAVGATLVVLLPATAEWLDNLRSSQATFGLQGRFYRVPPGPPPVAPRWYATAVLRASRWFDVSAMNNVSPLVTATAMAGVWVVGLAAYFRLLGGSVLRARIKPIHLARVNAYSADVLPVLIVLFAVAAVILPAVLPSVLPREWRWDTNRFKVGLLLQVGLLPMVLIVPLTLRLHGALRRYVRFPQAGGVAVGFAVIMTLIWAITVLQTMPIRGFW